MDKEQQFLQTIQEFLQSEEKTFTFPITLTSDDRKIVHGICDKLGYKSLSTGAGNARAITVTRERLSKDTIAPTSLRRFCADFLLPIEIFDSPLFEYYMDLYDPTYQTKLKFKYFQEALEGTGSENAFWHHYNKVKDSVQNHIKSKEGYQKLVQNTVKEHLPSVGHNDIYKPESHLKWFISIDLRSANFSTLWNFDESIVDGCDKWVDFIAKFTPYDYFKYAKYFRQILFGGLNGKAIAREEKQITLRMLNELKSAKILPDSAFISLSNDEIVVATSEDKILEDMQVIRRVLDASLPKISSFAKIEGFKVIQLSNDQLFFVKEVVSQNTPITEKPQVCEIQFKCILPCFFAQCYKHYFKKPIERNDLKFVLHGCTATWDKPLF